MRPALIVRVTVAIAALVSFGAGLAAYIYGWVPGGQSLPLAGALLVLVAAITRRYGIALPGNGFSSFVVGVMLYAILDRGWAFAAIVAPFAREVNESSQREPIVYGGAGRSGCTVCSESSGARLASRCRARMLEVDASAFAWIHAASTVPSARGTNCRYACAPGVPLTATRGVAGEPSALKRRR